jgi:DNA-binding LytR/AlgR family response regulator
MADTIRVAIVEDEPLYRGLLERHFARHSRLTVVGAFADGPSALASVPALAPDVITLDIELPGRVDGIQVGLTLLDPAVENQLNAIYSELAIDRHGDALHPRVSAVLAYLRDSRFGRQAPSGSIA